jgi:glycosyltransferase involved in cell wall biosynthesis
MRIGILGHDFITWGGGVDFLRTVIDSLLVSPRAEQAEFHLLIPDSGPRLRWRRFRRRLKAAKRRIMGQTPPADHAPSREILIEAFAGFQSRLRIQHIDIGRRALARATRQLAVDAVIPAVHSLGASFPRPWVAYAYDFQHKYFPKNFPPDDCRSRDEHFAELLTQARAVIVNARAAAADIARFVPQATARVFALPFAPSPNPDWFEDQPETFSRYSVSPPYFIVSNQFWAHKDHATAFEAFRRLAADQAGVSLVCTGSTAGSRDPEYFPRLMNEVQSWGLGVRVRVLGLIPKRDQIELMKHACAVIQPTLFEGGPGGGAVYDAVALDVPAIVSDIPVNREIEARGLEFFPAGNAEVLVAKMRTRLATPHQRRNCEELIALGRRSRTACGEVLWSAIDFAI